MKTVYQLIEEERKRQNHKIKNLTLNLANGIHHYKDVSNYKEIGSSGFIFDTQESHFEVWGSLVSKESEL
jgi:hypothetical protein